MPSATPPAKDGRWKHREDAPTHRGGLFLNRFTRAPRGARRGVFMNIRPVGVRVAFVAVAAGVAVLGAGGVAAADPMGEAFPVVCDNGVTYQVVVAGNGQFTPAHDVVSKGSASPPLATTTSCTFHVEGSEDGFTFVLEGNVTGFVTPVR